MNRRVAVVVPVYNAAESVRQLVEACLAQDYPAACLELIFVDDGSIDGTGKLLSSYPVTLLSRPNGGPACARNTGWRAARAEIIGFTTDRCLPGPDWVARLVDLFDAPKVGAVGGSYRLANPASGLARCLQGELEVRRGLLPARVQVLNSGNVAYRRTLLEALGGFPEDCGPAADAMLAAAIVQRGYQLRLDPLLRVGHRWEENLGAYLQSQVRHGYFRSRAYWRMWEKEGRLGLLHSADDSGWLDLLHPHLTLVFLGLGIASLRFSALQPWLLPAAVVTIGLLLPAAMVLAERRKPREALWFVPVALLRSLCRGVGMSAGHLACWVEHRSKARQARRRRF
ncbi:MAG: glycosyltransferase [Candidatus Tectomicrobia bacterium]|nr:glycosyltransferase [Candidatus Tectomicrobia bacterium]